MLAQTGAKVGLRMIEAWQVEHRPFAYFFLRRFELVRWTLRGKVLHREAKWYALIAALWLAITGYETERCCFCGWKVGVVWWCDDQDLWETVTGYAEGGGISCIQCFDDRANEKRMAVRWSVGPWVVARKLAAASPKEAKDQSQ